jgi:multiple sugar transport system permease protein
MSSIPSGGAEAAAEVAAASPMRVPPKKESRFSADTITGWLFSAPALFFIACFIILPFLLAFYFSFTNERLLAPPGRETEWIGLDNYARVFNNPRFWTALTNNVVFAIVVVPLQTFFALFLAILVNQRLQGVVVFRTIFFMPITVVMAATAVIWIVLLNPQGLVNAFFEIITFGNFSPDWLGDPQYALAAIMMVSIWASVGFQMIILLAALQDVPYSLYEAARLDGANTWQQFRNVTLPGIRNQLLFVLTITTILAFRLFDQVWIMPDRPGGPLDATRTLMVDIVDTGLRQQNVGRGSALSVIFLLIVLAVTIVQRRLVKQEGEVR